VTAEGLRAELVAVGTPLLVQTLERGLGEPTPQTGEPTYAEKIDPAELEIDWGRPSAEIDRLVRLGGAWTTHDGRRLKVWRVARDGPLTVPTGDGTLALVEVQPEGRARMPAADWARGARTGPPLRLGP
jgi:methionyl-tRNA formyltransferase